MGRFFEHFREKIEESVFKNDLSNDGFLETDGLYLGPFAKLTRIATLPAAVIAGLGTGFGLAGAALFIPGAPSLLFASAVFCLFTKKDFLLPYNYLMGGSAAAGLFVGKAVYGTTQTIGHGLDAICRVIDATLQAGVKTALKMPTLSEAKDQRELAGLQRKIDIEIERGFTPSRRLMEAFESKRARMGLPPLATEIENTPSAAATIEKKAPAL